MVDLSFIRDALVGFDIASFYLGLVLSVILVGQIVWAIHGIPLLFKFFKWLVLLIISLFSKRNSPPRGEDK